MKGKQCDSCELKHWGITSGKAKNLGFLSQAARVHLSFRAGSTFTVPVYTTSPGHWVNKADTQ